MHCDVVLVLPRNYVHLQSAPDEHFGSVSDRV